MMRKIFETAQTFRENHTILGRGFNELSWCLRAGDNIGVGRADRRIYEEAGPHICFEEEDFYPALVPLLGEETVRKIRQEHCCGLDAVRTLLNRDSDLPLPANLSERLLAQSEVMEAHIAECGELFAALRHIASADQQVSFSPVSDVFDTKRMPFKKQVYTGGGDLEIAWASRALASSCTASEQ
jgi:hypothetical protein